MPFSFGKMDKNRFSVALACRKRCLKEAVFLMKPFYSRAAFKIVAAIIGAKS